MDSTRSANTRDTTPVLNTSALNIIMKYGLLVTAACILALLPGQIALAQSPDDMPSSLRIPATILDDIEAEYAEDDEIQSAHAAPVKILVDTDPGVDDAAALVWLLSQNRYPIEVLGITTVAGNATLENGTNNVLILLDQFELTADDIPVIQGASAPLAQSLSSTGKFVHGPDGLWFLGFSNPHDLTGIPANAPEFICNTVAANPGILVVTLGPLTNIANAVVQCAAEMATAAFVHLAGAKFGGNTTPVAEFNIWADPEAAEIVMNAGLARTFVPLDAFQQLTFDNKDIRKLGNTGNPAIQFLLPALELYLSVQADANGATSLPDLAAMLYALDSALGQAEPALVKIMAGPDIPQLLRGQTIVGLTQNFGEIITMNADDAELSALADQAFTDPTFDLEAELFAIFLREPSNSTFVTGIDERTMWRIFERGVFGRGPRTVRSADDLESQSAAESQGASATTDTRIYIPAILMK